MLNQSMPNVRHAGLMTKMYKTPLEQLYDEMWKAIDKDIAKRKKELGIHK